MTCLGVYDIHSALFTLLVLQWEIDLALTNCGCWQEDFEEPYHLQTPQE